MTDTYDRSRPASVDRLLLAIALTEGMLDGDGTPTTLLPEASAESLALSAAQTSLSCELLKRFARGREHAVLDQLRAVVLSLPTEEPT